MYNVKCVLGGTGTQIKVWVKSENNDKWGFRNLRKLDDLRLQPYRSRNIFEGQGWYTKIFRNYQRLHKNERCVNRKVLVHDFSGFPFQGASSLAVALAGTLPLAAGVGSTFGGGELSISFPFCSSLLPCAAGASFAASTSKPRPGNSWKTNVFVRVQIFSFMNCVTKF